MKTLREEIEELLEGYYYNDLQEHYLNEILKAFKSRLPEKKTEGILGILGTIHRDGVFNEGFNFCLDEIEDLLK